MNYSVIIKIVGIILILEAIFMLPSLFLSLYYAENDQLAFIFSIVIISLIGFLMTRMKTKNNKLKIKDGFAIVTFGWLFATIFGALPFVFSNTLSFVDAFFETVSGLTTTGASVITNVEILPRGILFWRSFTHWIGGMGILVLTLAILPALGIGGYQIFKAESPGPIADKIAPRIKDTAKLLYISYFSLTIIEIILLLFGGMSLFDSLLHTFATVGTGGFSTKNASIGAYNSSYIQIVITIFMILSGANFSLYFALYKGKWQEVMKNEELRLYLLIIFISSILITANLFFVTNDNLGITIRAAFFQVASIMTTTGFATVDFDKWPTFSKAILFILMFIGGSSGSTGGSIKVIRLLVLLKLVKREFAKLFHPQAVIPIKIQNKALPRDLNSNIFSFFILYIFIFVIGTLLISLEDIGLESAASAVATTLGNVGPGFGFVGPTKTYSEFTDFSKIVFSILMLLGRLELFTIIVLIVPKNWRKEN